MRVGGVIRSRRVGTQPVCQRDRTGLIHSFCVFAVFKGKTPGLCAHEGGNYYSDALTH